MKKTAGRVLDHFTFVIYCIDERSSSFIRKPIHSPVHIVIGAPQSFLYMDKVPSSSATKNKFGTNGLKSIETTAEQDEEKL